MTDMVLLVVGAILVNNILLMKFLGNCPFLGCSQKMSTATGMAAAVVFVMTLAGVITWVVWQALLVPLGLEYLRTIAFILVIAALVQLVEIILQKLSPSLYKALGIFLPLITTNCIVLGVALLNANKAEFTFITATANGFAAGLGFSLVLVLFAAMRERIAIADVPKSFQGAAIGMITAGLMSLAFMGFSGLIKL